MPLPLKKRKSVSVTYVPDRSKAVDIGKRFTLRKRQTTIRPITFDISVAESDSPTLVSKDDIDKPEVPGNGKSRPSAVEAQTTRRNAKADSSSLISKDQVERKKRRNDDLTQATPGHQSSKENVGHQSSTVDVGHQSPKVNVGHQSSILTKATLGHQSSTVDVGHQSTKVNVGHQSSILTEATLGHQSSKVNAGHQSSMVTEASSGHQSTKVNVEHQSSTVTVGHQPLAAPLVKAGLQSSVKQSAQHLFQRMKAGHKSSALEAVQQSESVKTGTQSVREKLMVQKTAVDQSSTAEAGSQSIRHQALELDSLPGRTESQRSPPSGYNCANGKSGTNAAEEQARRSLDFGKENDAPEVPFNPSGNTDVPSVPTPTGNTGNTDHSELGGRSSHQLEDDLPLVSTKTLSSIKSALTRIKKGGSNNVTFDPVTSSSLHLTGRLRDNSDLETTAAAPHTRINGPLPKDGNAMVSHVPSDSNVSDFFRAPLPVKDSIYSSLMSMSQTPSNTPMRPPPNISLMPAMPLASPSFAMVPLNGQTSIVHLRPVGRPAGTAAHAKQRQLLQPTVNDQPLQDMVIRVKCNSPSSSSDEDGQAVTRPTVSTLSEFTVLVSAMEDTVDRFIETQPDRKTRSFLRDVTEEAFAKLRRTSQASHNINKLNRRLHACQRELRRKRKELLQLQQERNRLEVEFFTAKKEISVGTTDASKRDKINEYLSKLSRMTSEGS